MVPLDGSPFSEQALPLARSIAMHTGAALHLVHVHVPIAYVYLGDVNLGGVPTGDGGLDDDLRANEQRYLDAIRQRVATEDGPGTDCTLLDGPAAEALARHAATTDTDLIVMTTHGHGVVTCLWLGSVAHGLIHRSTVPILVLCPQHASRPGDPAAFRKMLIPLDGSPLAEAILEPALALGMLTGTEYVLVQIIDPRAQPGDVQIEYAAGLDDVVTEELRSAAEAYLGQVAATLRAQGYAVQTRVVIAEHTADTLLETAEASAADVIAMTTHRRGGLGRVLLGSVADSVVRGAATPVLLVRSQEIEEHVEEATGSRAGISAESS
jgi:nucleotide-binding universal stress UspA family protein